jgi:4-amino-4-deoxy-L-arabinose transferase-like glycosyltransferase
MIKDRLARISAWWYLLAITFLGLILRLINIKAEPYWGDEVLSLDLTRHFNSISQLLTYLREVEFHPPLYYISLHYWIHWFGQGTMAVRSLSLIFGLGCIVLVYFLGKKIFQSEKVGLIAALILAVLPFQIEFAQEARPYIIFCFFAGLAMLSLWEYLDSRKSIWLVVYALSSLLGLYLHYSFLFFLTATALFWLADLFFDSRQTDKSRTFLIWLSTHAAIGLGFAFWLTPFLYKLSLSSFIIFELPRNFSPDRQPDFFGQVFDQIIWLTKSEVLPKIVIFIKFIVELSFFAALLVWIKTKAESSRSDKRATGFLLWLIISPMVFFLFSFQSVVYTTIVIRHILFVTMPLAVLLAAFIVRLKPKIAVALLALFIFSLVPFITNVVGNDADFDQDFQLQAAGELINQNYQPGDLVIVAVGITRTNLNYFLDPKIPVAELLPINYFGLDFDDSRDTLGFVENEYQVRMKSATTAEINQKLDRLQKLYHPKRVWLYGFSQKDQVVHIWFSDHHFRHGFRSIGDIFRVDLYANQ